MIYQILPGFSLIHCPITLPTCSNHRLACPPFIWFEPCICMFISKSLGCLHMCILCRAQKKNQACRDEKTLVMKKVIEWSVINYQQYRLPLVIQGGRPVLDSCSKPNIEPGYVWRVTVRRTAKNMSRFHLWVYSGMTHPILLYHSYPLDLSSNDNDSEIRNWEMFGSKARCWPAITGIIRYSP